MEQESSWYVFTNLGVFKSVGHRESGRNKYLCALFSFRAGVFVICTALFRSFWLHEKLNSNNRSKKLRISNKARNDIEEN